MSTAAGNPWAETVLPDEVLRVPAMLSTEERQYLHWATSRLFEGFGEIVDLGPWIGGSSAALAAGLKDRGSSAKIRSYDLFEWRPSYMEGFLATGLPDGADFMHVFREQTAAFTPWIDAEKMDLFAAEWTGSTIEILFVDAAKTWGLHNAIRRTFFPFLEPGRSRVILQDFRHYSTPWLPLTFDSDPELWSQVEAVQQGDTVTFVPQRELTDADIAPVGPEGFSAEQFDAIYRRRIESEARVDNQVRFRLGWLCEVIRRGDEALADELQREIRAARDDSPAAANLGKIAMTAAGQVTRSHPDLARAIAERQLEEKPDDAAAMRILAVTSLRRGDAAVARELLQRSLELSPDDPTAHLHLAHLCRAASEVSAALRHAESALALLTAASPPGMLQWAFKSLGAAWQAGGAWPEDADAELEQRFGSVSSFHVLRATRHLHHGSRDAARAALDRALELAPEDEWARQTLVAMSGGA